MRPSFDLHCIFGNKLGLLWKTISNSFYRKLIEYLGWLQISLLREAHIFFLSLFFSWKKRGLLSKMIWTSKLAKYLSMNTSVYIFNIKASTFFEKNHVSIIRIFFSEFELFGFMLREITLKYCSFHGKRYFVSSHNNIYD